MFFTKRELIEYIPLLLQDFGGKVFPLVKISENNYFIDDIVFVSTEEDRKVFLTKHILPEMCIKKLLYTENINKIISAFIRSFKGIFYFPHKPDSAFVLRKDSSLIMHVFPGTTQEVPLLVLGVIKLMIDTCYSPARAKFRRHQGQRVYSITKNLQQVYKELADLYSVIQN